MGEGEAPGGETLARHGRLGVNPNPNPSPSPNPNPYRAETEEMGPTARASLRAVPAPRPCDIRGLYRGFI